MSLISVLLLAPLAGDVEVEALLLGRRSPFLPFLRRPATGMNDSLGRRPSWISPVGPSWPMLEVPLGRLVGRVEDRVLQRRRHIHHGGTLFDHVLRPLVGWTALRAHLASVRTRH